MNLSHHLARYIPDDPEVMSLDEEAVLAALEAFGLITRLQRAWRPRHGLVPPVKPKKLRGTVWARGDELSAYLEMALEEGRGRGHTWRELVPAIAARIPPAGHEMVFFVLTACAFDPRGETVEQGHLIEAFAAALGEDRAACQAAVVEHYRDHFDYERALDGLGEAAGGGPDGAGEEARAALIALLERLGMEVPGTRELEPAELEQLPETTLVALLDDAERSAALYLVPTPIIAPITRLQDGPLRSLSFAGPDDARSAQEWFAAVRLVSALGEEIAPHHDDYLGAFVDQPGCPGAQELAALQGAWAQYHVATFEDGSTAEGRAVRRGGLNARLRDLVLINRAM